MFRNTAVVALALLCLGAVMAERTHHHELHFLEDLLNRQVVSESCNRFAFEFAPHFFKEHKGNMAWSPPNTWLALTMLSEGAHGYNKDQMHNYLHHYHPEMGKHGIQSSLEKHISMKHHHLRMTYQIFHSTKFSFKKHFEEMMATYWKSSPISVDFTKAEETVKTINDWAEREVGMKNYFTREQFTDNYDFVLLNAVYFSGKWAVPFEMAPGNHHFQLDDKTSMEVPMMHRHGQYGVGYLFNDHSAVFIQIPVEHHHMGEAVYMNVIVPRGGKTLAEIESRWHEIQFSHMKVQDYLYFDFYMPKVKFESAFEFEHLLHSFGMSEMWKDGADFSDMTEKVFKLNKFYQKAGIDVNEQGATVPHTSETTTESHEHNPDVFKVDRPFFVMYTSYETVLISARITKPIY